MRSIAAVGARACPIRNPVRSRAASPAISTRWSEHLALDKFHLLGVAGGGFAALDYAAWRPERLRSLVVGASTGAIADKEIADFIARIAIPDIRKQSAHYREIGASYRGANPEGTKRWIEIDEARAPARRGLSAAAAHAEYLRQDRDHSDADAGDRRRRRSVGAAGFDAAVGAAHAKLRMGGDPDAGHAMAWERPGTFNDIVLDFLARH